MIGLAARFAVSGGRESLVRLVLTAVGVAIGTTMLLLAAAADPAIRAQQRHTAWQYTNPFDAPADAGLDPLLWWLQVDGVAGRTMDVLRVAATGPSSPVPLGLGHVPADGEVYVSPALASLLEELPADRLGDRFPSAPSGLIGDEYLAGPDDLVAVIGESVEEMRALDAWEITRVQTEPEAYQFTDFLRIILGVGAVGLLMPVVVFVSTSTRIGAARREQRFAAMRLAGATPRQVRLVAGVEAGAAALVGVVLGVIGFAVARPYAARIEIDGHPPFVHDVQVAPVLFATIIFGVPALAVAAAVVSLRRLQISPLGVARRAGRPRPTARRLVPFGVGALGFVVALAAAVESTSVGVLIPVMVTFGLMIYGIVAAGPWLTVLTARAIGRIAHRASALLAGRRLEDDPSGGFRAVSGLVVAVFVASVFSGVTPALMAEGSAGPDGLVAASTLATGLPIGTPAEDARAAVVAAAAAGGGDGLVLHTDIDPDRPLADPAVGRSHTLLVACNELAAIHTGGACAAGSTGWVDIGLDEWHVEPSPYTEEEVSSLPAEVLVIETDGSEATTDRVRTAVQRTVSGAVPFLGSEHEAETDRQIVQLNRLANLALAVTLAIAGCSLAVAVAAGIIERKRPFALLRLSGMHLAELRRVAFLEAAAPLLLIAGASALLGLATSAVIVATAGGIPWSLPSIGYWGSLAGGIVVALAVAVATLPLLGRTTTPSAVRFE